METKKVYIVLGAHSPKALSDEVNAAIGEGYWPHGWLVTDPTGLGYLQPMVLLSEVAK